MRIGIIELYCGASGKTGYYNSQEIGLAKALTALGHEVTVFYPHPSDEPEVDTVGGIRIVRVPALKLGNHGRLNFGTLSKYGLEAAVIGADNQLFAPGLIAFLKRRGVKVLCYIGTVKSEGAGRIKGFLMYCLLHRNLRAYRGCSCLAKTESLRKELINLGISNVALAPVGLDLSVIPEDEASVFPAIAESNADVLPADSSIKSTVLFVGRMDPYKRPLEALELFAMLPGDMRFVMIGTGSLDGQVEERIRSLGLKDRVTRIKSVPNEKIHSYYRNAKYYVNLNENEIFGMSILEAMYQGCTVIARSAPGPKEIIEDGVSGFLADSDEEMKQIVESGRSVKAEAARARVLSHFTWEHTALVMDGLIREDES